MRKESLLVKMWNVLWPLLIYSIAQVVTTFVGSLIAGYEYALYFLLAAAVICIPIYYKMYKKDCDLAGKVKRNIPMENKDYIAIIITGAALAIAMNNIITITPLPYLFKGYEETNEVLFGGPVVLQIMTAGIFSCIVEEMSHRGVVYLRMKRYWGQRTAMILSALVFGIYHLNVVQAVYAFFLGLFFAWLYERYDSLWAPIIGHMSANLFVIVLGSSELVLRVMSNLVGFCLITCIAFLVFYYGWRFMNQTNPLVELEFVDKEPDTLEGLTREYKEQEREEGKH